MNETDPTPDKPSAVASGEVTGTPEEPAKRGYPFRTVLGAAILSLLGVLATAGVKSYRDLDAAKTYERELLEEIAETRERVRGLDHRIERIQNDPAMLERLAREDLGMVREGDVVIVLPDDANYGEPAPSVRPSAPPPLLSSEDSPSP